MPVHSTWVEISEQALISNINTVKSLLSEDASIFAVVKANAYGHGFKGCAQIFARNGINAFAVNSIEEALQLRNLLPSSLILVLGYVHSSRYEDAIEADIHLTISSKHPLTELERVAAKHAKQAFVHLEIDTGLSRLGIMPEFLSDLLSDLRTRSHVSLEGVSSHFSDPDDQSFSAMQYQRFEEALAKIHAAGFTPPYIHCAKSAAVILYPQTHGTMTRPGLILYGLWPSEATEAAVRHHNVKCELTPALTWKTRIAEIKSIPSGTPVSYGMTETVTRHTRIAILPVGYADGYDRLFSRKAHVLINGLRCKVLGRVCMNMVMVDISALPHAELDQEVILLGTSGRSQVTARELANLAGTIEYEIVSRIHPDIPRVML